MTDRVTRYIRLWTRPTVRVNIQWELAGLWVGFFYRKTVDCRHFLVCLIPTVIIHVTVLRRDLCRNGECRQ